MDRKNVATLQTCCRETKSAKKLVFYLKKAIVLAAKNAENGAFLAHPEPEILLIEVAYFSAATEYTFSAHCNIPMWCLLSGTPMGIKHSLLVSL